MSEFIVTAPNGKEVRLNVGGYIDKVFLHKSVITDENIAKQYPQIFKPYVSKPNRVVESAPEPVVKPEIKEKVEEKEMEEPKKQMLTEVPKMEVLAEEDDKPEVVEPEILQEILRKKPAAKSKAKKTKK